MKRAAIVMILLALFAAPMALADSEEDAGTQAEMNAMATGLGAQVRLLQLEKAIVRGIARGNDVIEAVRGNGNDTAGLDLIIAEMKALRSEVQAAEPAAATQVFVDLKQDARELSQRFREQARGMISQQQADALKKPVENPDLAELAERVREKRKEYNSETLAKAFDALGIDDSALLERFRSGNATLKEVRKRIKEALKSMAIAQKTEALAKLKEEGVRRASTAKATLDKIKLKQIERKEERAKQRIEKLGSREGKPLKNYTEKMPGGRQQENVSEKAERRGGGQ